MQIKKNISTFIMNIVFMTTVWAINFEEGEFNSIDSPRKNQSALLMLEDMNQYHNQIMNQFFNDLEVALRSLCSDYELESRFTSRTGRELKTTFYKKKGDDGKFYFQFKHSSRIAENRILSITQSYKSEALCSQNMLKYAKIFYCKLIDSNLEAQNNPNRDENTWS